MAGKSLTALLTRRLILIQAAITLATMIAITWQLRDNYVSYVNAKVPAAIASAIAIDHAGQLSLNRNQKITELLDKAPGLWFVVADESGHRLRYGEIPAAYLGLAESVAQLQHADAHSNRAPYVLTMLADVIEAPAGRLHVLCGGAPTGKPGGIFIVIADYLGWRLALPLALLSLIVIPWAIRRSMAGVAQVAGQAQAINMDERGVHLAEHAVPRELQPLVSAFNAALQRLNEGYAAYDRFLASAAHELRAPIAMLEAQIETLDASAHRTRLLTGIARLANLAEQLLDLQRLGKQHGKFEPVDLVALAQEVTADAAPLAVDAGYTLALEAPASPVMVLGDRLSLSRVLTNLLQNAMAYGGGQGLITVDVKAEGMLGVRDQGPGIPVAQRQRVFEPFYRLRPGLAGAGLGLHLVQEIVALHGGRVELTESPGGGAWFRVKLGIHAAAPPG